MEGQISIFDYFQEQETSFNPLEELALHGSGFSGGMSRILKFFSENHTISDKAKFLKKEYGIGGFGSPTKKPCYIHSMDTFSNGKKDIVFEYYDENMNDISSGCSWEELAKTITDMIAKGKYKETR